MENRWERVGSAIVWEVAKKSIPHTDHLEMSGKKASQYVEYGVTQEGKLYYCQKVVFPMLRMIPNNTHASLIESYGQEVFPKILADGEFLEPEYGNRIVFDSLLTLEGISGPLKVCRSFYPCHEATAVVQKVRLTNLSRQPVRVEIEPFLEERYRRGVHGIYTLTAEADTSGEYVLSPGDGISFCVVYSGRKLLEQPEQVFGDQEEEKRLSFWKNIQENLCLRTPDALLNQAVDFAKLRASESVFRTRNGLMHSPGGLAFYAAVWTNDQAEYAGPFFPFLGEQDCIEATLNCYRLYRPFMGPEYTHIPTSIIAEGEDIWEGAGDRGDAAMYAYGAARFALSLGREEIARELWEPITWCLEYCRRQLNEHGVVASDSDELENRFPSGNANLCTSALYYDALRSASYLGKELGEEESATQYLKQAEMMRESIDRYFGANVSGFQTYRYYDGNDCLRAWICIPLAMGIFDRKEETIRALFSPKLWTQDGLATQEGDKTFWDRATLYGLRGVLYAGEADCALPYLMNYTRRRVLGEHVPYPVEAWPEGNQRHLAAESALYCRIFTEGVFGISPRGLRTFACRPCLPTQWPQASLQGIHAFGREFSLFVSREGEKYRVRAETSNMSQEAICGLGEEVLFTL